MINVNVYTFHIYCMGGYLIAKLTKWIRCFFCDLQIRPLFPQVCSPKERFTRNTLAYVESSLIAIKSVYHLIDSFPAYMSTKKSIGCDNITDTLVRIATNIFWMNATDNLHSF